MRQHPRLLEAYGITPARYAELSAYCLQVPEYRRAIRRARAGIVDRRGIGSGAWRPADPTGNRAAGIADDCAWMQRRIKLIERCAHRAGAPAVARAIIRNVTEDLRYEALRPPMGRNQFYQARLWFFIFLDDELRSGG